MIFFGWIVFCDSCLGLRIRDLFEAYDLFNNGRISQMEREEVETRVFTFAERTQQDAVRDMRLHDADPEEKGYNCCCFH